MIDVIKMNKIIFNRTSNIFLNSGIIALDYYLEKYKNEFNFEFSFSLNEDFLEIESDNLYDLLESIYYKMGKEVYDTSGKKARKKPDKYYFIEDPFQGIPFYKMFSYGIAYLITNNPQPVARKKENKIKFAELYKNNKQFAIKIAKFLHSKNKKIIRFSWNDNTLINDNSNNKGDSEIFINEEYTKTTKLEIDKDYFQNGEMECYLTNEKYKKLVDIQSTSPFIAGLDTFESYSKDKTKKISWKAMYLSRFSPKIGFYSYVQGLEVVYNILCKW